MNIYVGNLAFDVTEAALRHEFGVFGQVSAINIMNDKYIGSGQLRMYGYVEMIIRTEAEAAIAGLGGKTLNGRIIEVVEARPLSNSRTGAAFPKSRRNRLSATRDR